MKRHLLCWATQQLARSSGGMRGLARTPQSLPERSEGVSCELKRNLFEQVKPEATLEEIETFIDNLATGWPKLDVFTQREILRYHVPGGFVLDHGILCAGQVLRIESIRQD